VNDGQGVNDCYGHGTHVAGIIGGSIHGVAKGVVLHPVRVFGCSGGASASAIIGAVNFVTINKILPGVVNMSLGGGASSALDAAVQKSIASGLTYVASAGNSAANACNTSPARAPNVITVGATTSVDARSSFSNFGTCVDLFAPGSSITSPWASSDTALNTLSGTSASSAHVAGAAALYLAAHPQASAAAVRNALVNGATANVITNPGTGSPNRLLFTLVP
jgi:subtilisin family serine protease